MTNRIVQRWAVTVSLCLTCPSIFSAAETSKDSEVSGREVSFQNDVQPIFRRQIATVATKVQSNWASTA